MRPTLALYGRPVGQQPFTGPAYLDGKVHAHHHHAAQQDPEQHSEQGFVSMASRISVSISLAYQMPGTRR